MKYVLSSVFFSLFFPCNLYSFDHNYKSFNEILVQHVRYDGLQSYFNYKKLKENPGKLNNFLNSLSSVSKNEFDSFTKDRRLSFLINAYNAFTLKIIIDNYPVKSIKDIGSLFKNTWKKEFFTLLGKKSHLDNIEHNLIRKNFNEPRIHFAVNCASIGCPSLLNQAFRSTELNQQLEKTTKGFLSNTTKNRFKNKELRLSKIFKWYAGDFEKKFGSVEKFIAPYISKDKIEQNNIASKKYTIDWTDYNWSLNEKK